MKYKLMYTDSYIKSDYSVFSLIVLEKFHTIMYIRLTLPKIILINRQTC